MGRRGLIIVGEQRPMKLRVHHVVVIGRLIESARLHLCAVIIWLFLLSLKYRLVQKLERLLYRVHTLNTSMTIIILRLLISPRTLRRNNIRLRTLPLRLRRLRLLLLAHFIQLLLHRIRLNTRYDLTLVIGPTRTTRRISLNIIDYLLEVILEELLELQFLIMLHFEASELPSALERTGLLRYPRHTPRIASLAHEKLLTLHAGAAPPGRTARRGALRHLLPNLRLCQRRGPAGIKFEFRCSLIILDFLQVRSLPLATFRSSSKLQGLHEQEPVLNE